ncbi:nuclear transport factor 2 family protein [Spirillospora sp. NPDC048911]|uniref:nuclear transport factor 2 family protein n=1 Tax=Spirillospora sp. NPDC048911 TaxID=3364527 RepID=UPI0037237B5E
MYRKIVTMVLRRAFGDLNPRTYTDLLKRFAPTFEYEFVGDHALGGRRTVLAAQKAWFERMFRLFPDGEVTVRDVLAAGWPWRTRIMAIWEVRSPAGGGYRNLVTQYMEMRWFRITKIITLEDTQHLVRALEGLAADGVAEAAAPPITDDPATWHVPSAVQV